MNTELDGWLRPAMLLSALLGLVVCTNASAAEDLTVEAQRSGSAVAVEARATLRAPADLIWKTLTDYDHLSEFIPGMNESKMIDRRGGAAIVEQHGEARFLVFSYGIDVVVESAEYPPDRIEIHVISGNLRQLDGAYRLSAGDEEGTWVLRWSGLVEPTMPVPSFLAVGLMRRNVEAQFSGMVAEIEKRQAQMAERPKLLVSSKAW